MIVIIEGDDNLIIVILNDNDALEGGEVDDELIEIEPILVRLVAPPECDENEFMMTSIERIELIHFDDDEASTTYELIHIMIVDIIDDKLNIVDSEATDEQDVVDNVVLVIEQIELLQLDIHQMVVIDLPVLLDEIVAMIVIDIVFTNLQKLAVH